MRSQRAILWWLVPLVVCASPQAKAADVGYAVHFDGVAGRMVGARKSEQFTWGGGAFVAPELTVTSRVGIELVLGGIALAEGTSPIEGLDDTGTGYAAVAVPALRLRPFGRHADPRAVSAAGLWLAGGAGLAYTGKVARGAVDASLGYDFFAGRSLRIGPSVGFLQILETQSIVLPEDARIVTFGFHGAFEPPVPVPAPLAPIDDDPDRDGIRGALDRCPLEPEDQNGFEDDDGCPDASKDTDRDRIPDVRDKCPLVKEDYDRFHDGDGCPEPDNDEDKILDVADSCPNDPETYNGYADEDGCPDEKDVRVVGEEIIVDDTVLFRVNDAEVQVRSWPLIGRVAGLLKMNPQYALVRIQGHADSTGSSDYNVDLSVRRANSVRELLIGFGVAPDRLVVEAYGDLLPAEQGETEAARRKNRRVAFTILKRIARAGEEPAGVSQ
jgi:outer membrane protein OmpA-like peptidoglycan-associated protein